MNHNMKLQLFADGGGDGSGGAAAAGSAAMGGQAGGKAPMPGADRLRALGVPEDRIQKYMKRREAAKQGRKGSRPIVGSRENMAQPPQAKSEQVQTAANHMGSNAPVKKIAPSAFPHGDRDVQIRSHYDGLSRQARAMGQRYPDFDLSRELDNPTFLKLTGPAVGLSVEDAYMAVHHRELMEAVARGARQEMANAVRAGSARPAEHGMGAKAPGVVTFDYKNASRSEREAFKKEIYAAAARGEKIYPR